MTSTRRGTLLGMGAVTLTGRLGYAKSTSADTNDSTTADTNGYAPVPGGRVWWRKVGSGPKTPILLLHGGAGAAHNYLLPLAALAKDRTVIFYDQLGCGTRIRTPRSA
jgi:proline iminopeptidase